MSLLLDSEAQVASRAREVGLTPAVVESLKDAGVNHLSALAFVSHWLLAEVDTFLQGALGRAATIAEFGL